MASVNAPSMERRHIPDRRTTMARSGPGAMSGLDYTAMVLMIVGGLNWAMVGLFDVDVVASLFGTGSALTRLVYVVVGLAALYSIYTLVKMGRNHTGHTGSSSSSGSSGSMNS